MSGMTWRSHSIDSMNEGSNELDDVASILHELKKRRFK